MRLLCFLAAMLVGAVSLLAVPEAALGVRTAPFTVPASNTPWFEDITAKAGVAHKHTNRSFQNPYAPIMEVVNAQGAAVAVADYDGDGIADIFVTDSKVDGKNRLYHNNGDLTFTDVAEQAGVANGNDESNASADALWLDYNNDG